MQCTVVCSGPEWAAGGCPPPLRATAHYGTLHIPPVRRMGALGALGWTKEAQPQGSAKAHAEGLLEYCKFLCVSVFPARYTSQSQSPPETRHHSGRGKEGFIVEHTSYATAY